jgi:hypothetical protein
LASFAEQLAGMPDCGHLSAIHLTGPAGDRESIENRPGSQGSLRIYAYLAGKYGAITPAAAREGLGLYAEHGADARAHPGKHPNIDRLLRVIQLGETWRVELQPT